MPSGALISDPSNTQFLLLSFLPFACWCFRLLLQQHFTVLYILSTSEFGQSPWHLGWVNRCTYLALYLQGQTHGLCLAVETVLPLDWHERRVQHCLFSPFAGCVCTVPACTAEAEGPCQVLYQSVYRDFISSLADKELTPSPTLQQEEDLEEIAASFLRHTQMLNINIGSSVKIFSCYPSDGKNIWME